MISKLTNSTNIKIDMMSGEFRENESYPLT